MNPPPMVFVVFAVFATIPIDSIWVAKKEMENKIPLTLGGTNAKNVLTEAN